MFDPSFLYLNETALFFHNRKFKTPETKQNRATRIKTWAQGVPPLLAAVHINKKRKTSTSGQISVGRVSTGISLSLKKGNQQRSYCTRAVVITSMTVPLGNKHSLKRQLEHVDLTSDVDESTVPTTVYGGLEEEDDSLEALAAANDPMTPWEAREESKVGVAPTSSIFIPPHSHVKKACVKIIAGDFGSSQIQRDSQTTRQWEPSR